MPSEIESALSHSLRIVKVAVALVWHLKLQGICRKGRTDKDDLCKTVTLGLVFLSSTCLSTNHRLQLWALLKILYSNF